MKLALFSSLLVVACSRGDSRTHSTPSSPPEEMPTVTSPTPENDPAPWADEVCEEDWTDSECDHAIVMQAQETETTEDVEEADDRADPLQ